MKTQKDQNGPLRPIASATDPSSSPNPDEVAAGRPALLEWVFAEQLKVMREQLDLLAAQPGGGLMPLAASGTAAAAPASTQAAPVQPPSVRAVVSPADHASPQRASDRRADGVPTELETAQRTYPLSEAQREMWLGAQMRPESAGPHHACTGLWLEGAMDIRHLREAIARVIGWHENLRSTFSEDGTQVIVHPPGVIEEFRSGDLSHLPESERDRLVQSALDEEAHRLLDLERGPLVSFRLLTLGSERHLLIFTAQMIVCDGWSHYVVFEDLAEAYSALAMGKEPALPTPVRLREFLDEQQSQYGAEGVESCEVYWLEQFKEIPPVLDLPTSRPRPPVRTYHAARHTLTLDMDLCREIRRVARERKNSYFALLLAAFQVWLQRLSGCSDLVVGVPFAVQGILGLERFVGQCANTLPLRCRIDPRDSFAALLERTWLGVLDANEQWQFTFGQLASKLDMPRDPSRLPLVPVLFNLDTPMTKVKFHGLQHRFCTGPRVYYQYDLGFNLVEDERTMRVECDYNTNLFDADVIRAWTEGYEALLRAIVRDVNQPMGRLPMMNERDPGRWVPQGSDSPEDVEPDDRNLHKLVSQQAVRTPDAIAVEAQGARLTYRELEEQAGRLATRLRGQGVARGGVVGVCLERSVQLPVALLAVLKLGAAYVLIEPQPAVSRLTEIIGSSGMQLLIVDGSTREGLSAIEMPRVEIESLCGAVTAEAGEIGGATGVLVDGEDPACVSFTSGFEGEPKCVEVSHRAMVRLLRAMRSRPGIGPGDVMLGMSPVTFYMSMAEIWLPLTAGARLVLVPGNMGSGVAMVAQSIEQHGITVLQATPSTWHLLCRAGWKGSRRLRAWSGGEPLSPNLAERLLPLCAELWNLYGVAESGGCCLASRVESGTAITLGRPIAGTSVQIVDDLLEPVPVGVPGQLLVGGSSLARGYAGRPDLTTDRFRVHASGRGGDVEARMFHSGDVVRRTADGRIEHLGRAEPRAGIQGTQIHLREIEAAMERHGVIQQAVATVRDDVSGNKLLVGYAVREGEAPDIEELRGFLSGLMPACLVPDQFVFLQAFPLTPHNTLDRSRLPAPDVAGPPLERRRRNPKVAMVAPGTSTEKALAQIWSEVLGIERIGVHDNFFDLGGESMLVMKAVMLAGRSGLGLTPRSIFQHQSIDKLAAWLDQNTSEQGARTGSMESPTGPVPLTPAQHRFLYEREIPNPHHWNFSVLLQGDNLDCRAIQRAIRELHAHHDALRLRLCNDNWIWTQSIGDVAEEVRFESHNVAELEPESQPERIHAICARLQSGLNLAHGPVLQVAHFACGSGQPDRLFFVFHHFVMDFLSWDVYREDFELAYSRALTGAPIEFPRKTTSFREWAIKLRNLTKSSEVEKTVPRWLGLPWDEVRPIPLDHARRAQANTNESARECELLLSPQESSPILRPKGDHRPEEVILAALARALGEWTGSEAVLIDSLNHGRGIVEEAVLSRTVGFMLSYSPLVLRVNRDLEVGAELAGSIEQMRGLPPGFTFDLLRFFSEDPGVQGAFARLPRAEVLFNFFGHVLDVDSDGKSVFRRSVDPCGSAHSPVNGRYHALAVSAAILGERVRFKFVYSKNLHRRETLRQLAAGVRKSFQS